MILKSVKRFILKSKLSDLEKKIAKPNFSFSKVKSVGIVFSANDIETIELVKKYMSLLINAGKRVSAICFFNNKNLPPLPSDGLLIDFVLPKEVTFMGVPKPSFVRGFIENKFDLLLDLDLKNAFPVEYVAAMSRANFKVAKHTIVNQNYFDFMIKVESEKNVGFLIEQIDVYLKKL